MHDTPRKTISGAAWTRASGQKPVAVTLPPDLHRDADMLAAALGLRGRSDLGRKLFRFATQVYKRQGLKKIQKILSESLDSLESRE